MQSEAQSQRSLSEEELHGLEWRVRQMYEAGEPPEEVEQKLIALGLTEDSAKQFVSLVFANERKNRENERGEFAGSFIAVPAVVIGLLLVAGNVTGIFPTFPYAGFVVMVLGVIVGGIVGSIASKTAR